MAGEKKTLKTRLIQVGSQKFDAPYSLADLIITTDGRTVKEILDEFDVEIGNPKDIDNNIEATGLYKLIEELSKDESIEITEDNIGTDGISFGEIVTTGYILNTKDGYRLLDKDGNVLLVKNQEGGK